MLIHRHCLQIASVIGVSTGSSFVFGSSFFSYLVSSRFRRLLHLDSRVSLLTQLDINVNIVNHSHKL